MNQEAPVNGTMFWLMYFQREQQASTKPLRFRRELEFRADLPFDMLRKKEDIPAPPPQRRDLRGYGVQPGIKVFAEEAPIHADASQAAVPPAGWAACVPCRGLWKRDLPENSCRQLLLPLHKETAERIKVHASCASSVARRSICSVIPSASWQRRWNCLPMSYRIPSFSQAIICPKHSHW